MKEDSHLRARLDAFRFDDPAIALPFSARLARENGWTRAYALRVIKEYRRFLYLTQVAGREMTPSEDVDAAWHLHLVYTRSYWDELCGKVLGQPLHHLPTSGAASENVRFREAYGATLVAYATAFGGKPAADIWPDVDARFAPATSASAKHSRTARIALLGLAPTTAGAAWAAGGASEAGLSAGSLFLICAGTGAVMLWIVKRALASNVKKGPSGCSSGCSSGSSTSGDSSSSDSGSGCGSSGCGGGGGD